MNAVVHWLGQHGLSNRRLALNILAGVALATASVGFVGSFFWPAVGVAFPVGTLMWIMVGVLARRMGE